jgi:Protein of unknown function
MKNSSAGDTPEIDRHLSSDEEYRVSSLSGDEIREIDDALMSVATVRFRKIAFVAGFAMLNLQPKFKGIPDVFFARRVRKLIGEGKLIVDGNPEHMGASEVRLSDK